MNNFHRELFAMRSLVGWCLHRVTIARCSNAAKRCHLANEKWKKHTVGSSVAKRVAK